METKTTLLSLPMDIIFDILTRLPTHFLHNHGRFVCKSWANIIKDHQFIKAHAFRSTCGLLFQYSSSETVALFAEVKEQVIEVAEFDRFFAGKDIVGSSAGVVLLRSKSSDENLYIANPVTYQILELPRLPSHTGVSIAYMPNTGEIKVICHNSESRHYKPQVLTVGRNMAWRPMDTKPKPNVPPKSLLRRGHHPIFSLDGVVYYTAQDLKDGSMKLFANDLSDESIYHINLPHQIGAQFYWIMSTGKSLSLIYWPSLIPFNVASTWKLKDFKKSEWVEGERLEIEENSEFHLYSQVGWVENSEILFHCDWPWPVSGFENYNRRIEDDERTIAAYDRRLGKLVDSWKGRLTSDYNLMAHKHTLVSW